MKTKKLNSTIAMLKEYKESNGITYEELSAQTGYNIGTLNSWINGTVNPLPESLKEIERFLNRVYASKFVDVAEADKTYIDSRLVAKWAGKTHKNLVRDIKEYIKGLEKSQQQLSLGLKSDPLNKAQSINVFNPKYYFIESHYTHPINKRKLPCYLVTQRGCEMIANKMTGVKGIAFTALYIDEYHRLKSEDTQTIEAPQEAPKIEQVNLFDHEPQTPEERDLLYLKQRLLEDTKDARTIVSFAVGISKTWKILKAIKDAKHITDYN